MAKNHNFSPLFAAFQSANPFQKASHATNKKTIILLCGTLKLNI